MNRFVPDLSSVPETMLLALHNRAGEASRESPEPDSEPGQKPKTIKVKLADGKARTIQHMMCPTFWHPDGTPMSAQQFLEMLFGKLPEFFKDEAELRKIQSAPDTRKKLLEGLAEIRIWPRSARRDAKDH